jgi:ABC-type ATPase with predicted acetyltransferase domain
MNPVNQVPNDHELVSTLWQCQQCGSFVSIHSPIPVLNPECPACAMNLLNFCGTFDSILHLDLDGNSKKFC